MARVSSIAHAVREFTGGLDAFELEARTVGELLRAMEQRFPGLGAHVREQMALAIDGEIHQDALAEPLRADSEVVLIPRIGGG